MKSTLSLIRFTFVIFSLTIFSAAGQFFFVGGWSVQNLLFGASAGVCFIAIIWFIDWATKQVHIQSWNLVAIGLFFGYLMAEAAITVTNSALTVAGFDIYTEVIAFIRVLVYLATIYLGMVLTLRGSDELHLSIPFVRFHASDQKKRDILIDVSALEDCRLIDLAGSGIIDHHLVIPRFVMKEVYSHLESDDKYICGRARRAMDVLKRLETMPELSVRYDEIDFPEINETTDKLVRLARMQHANIITADLNRIKQFAIESTEGVKVVNLNLLSNALKPISQSGEDLEIKIQRQGKEVSQGVGYLEDGTMVVVNGGGDCIGKIIKAHVLSVKHTSSGRIIFCNAGDEEVRTVASTYYAMS